MPAAIRIAGKDLKLRLRDRSVFIIGVIAPLMLAFIFNLIFGSALGGGELTLEYGLVDLDRSPASAAFAGVLDDLETREVLTNQTYADVEAAEAAVEAGDIDAFFVVESGFEAAVATGGANIDVIGDVDAPTSTQIATAIAEQYATGVEAARLAIFTTAAVAGTQPTPEFVASLEGDPSTAAFSYLLTDASAESHQLDSTTYYAVGMAIFFLFFTVQTGVIGLLEEEREGTLNRLFAAPISRWSVVLGKAILSFGLGVTSMAVLVVSTSLLMGAEWGPPLGVALLVGAGVLAGTGIIGLVAAFTRTPEGAENLASIIAVILGLLGGVFFPLGQGDDLLSRLSLITPHAWMFRGLGDISGGASWLGALPAVAALLAFALVTGSLGWLLMRRRLAR
jgi:ABC-2 type transport system permease protein